MNTRFIFLFYSGLTRTHFILWSLLVFINGTTLAHQRPVDNDSLVAERYLKRAGILYEESLYDSLPVYYQMALELYKDNEVEKRAECIIGLAEYYRLIANLNKSKLYLNQFRELTGDFTRTSDYPKAEYHYVQGKIFRDEGNYNAAIYEIIQSIKMFSQLTNYREKLSRIYNMLGTIYYMQGQLDSAEIMYDRSFDEINLFTSDYTIEKAWYYSNMSRVMKKKGHFDYGLKYIIRSIKISKEIHGNYYPELVVLYLDLASYYILLAENDSAMIALAYADTLINKFPGETLRYIGILDSHRAEVLYREGNYPQAANEYRQALLDAVGYFGRDNPILIPYYNNLGNCFFMIKDYDSALRYYRYGLEHQDQVNPSGLLNTWYYLARTYAQAGDDEKAKQYFERLIAGRVRYFGSDNLPLSFDYLSFGEFLIRIGKKDAGFEYCRKALEIRLKTCGEKHYLTSAAYHSLGTYFLEEVQTDSALTCFHRALLAVSTNFNDTNVASIPAITQVSDLLDGLKALKGKAEAFRIKAGAAEDKNRKIDFLTYETSSLDLAVAVISQLRDSWLTEESKLFLYENERETFLSLMQAYLLLHQLSGDNRYVALAYNTAESIKYTALKALIQEKEALIVSNVPDDLQAEELALKKSLSAYRELIRNEYMQDSPDSLKISSWSKSLYSLDDEWQALVHSMERRFPEYYALKYNTKLMSTRAINRKLGNDEVLVEYVFTDTSLVRFYLNGNHIICHQVTTDGSFLNDISIVKDFLSRDFYMSGSVQERNLAFARASNNLYRILLDSLTIPENRRVIIIPDGDLSYLPFDILLTGPVETGNYEFQELPFLIRKYPISYAYSATLLWKSTPRSGLFKKSLLAFAPSYNRQGDKPDSLFALREIPVNRNMLAPLPKSEDEVRLIKNILGGDLKIGYEASELSFKEMASKYRILHLAMHTIIDDQDPLYSKLVFSANTEGGEDGCLNIYEIYNLRLNASMVVLSACKTGSGLLNRGEGIMSLARAFFYAGIPNVIMTLWTVSDDSAEDLMIEFYEQLAKGHAKDISLRNAKLDYLEKSSPINCHPFYWSGFIVLGDTSPVFVRSSAKYLFLVCVILLVIPGFIYKNRLLKKGKEKKGLQAF